MQWTDSPCINNDSPHPDFYPSQLRRNMNQSTNERAAFPHLRTDQPLESALWGGKPSGIRRSHGGSKIHGHLWLYDVLSMSPVTSKLPELWRKTAPPCQSPSVQPSPTPPPPSRSNFLPHLTTVTELLLLAVLKLSFAAEQRLLQPIDKNFIRRQALLCGVRGGEMF